MAPRVRVRKLQDDALLHGLEDALTTGEPLKSALVRLGVSRSTLDREMKRNEVVRRRIESALRASRAKPPETVDPAITAPAEAAVHLAEAAVPQAAALRHDAHDRIAAGTGRVFASRRPHPLARVRRMALPGALPRPAPKSGSPLDEGLAVHDWLPALLVLIADVVIALSASGNLIVVAMTVLVAAAYVTVIGTVLRRFSRGPVPAGPVNRAAAPLIVPRAASLTPYGGAVRRDLAWLQGTMTEPMPGQPRACAPRERPRA
jgi:hypothetical protein